MNAEDLVVGEGATVREALERINKTGKGVALVAPELLLLLRAVVGAVDVADVVAVVAVRVAEEE